MASIQPQDVAGPRTIEISAGLCDAFAQLSSNASLFALPIIPGDAILQALQPIPYPKDDNHTFQQALNQLNSIIDFKTAAYLIIRRPEGLNLLTYVPYRANAETKALLLENRSLLLKTLGEEHFSSSIICKENVEITDARSWEERGSIGKPSSTSEQAGHAEPCEGDCGCEQKVEILGHKKNKCRLCDRRMQNKIEDDALEALKGLANGGNCIQLSVNVSTEVLQLNFRASEVLSPTEVATRLPNDKPSFTFYRHIDDARLYFIFCSPDSAGVKERMKHTMAIPGLINIIAPDNGVHVDQKLEVHDADELDFGKQDERIGKFRSMYLRNEFDGTESQWEGMAEQQKILDAAQ